MENILSFVLKVSVEVEPLKTISELWSCHGKWPKKKVF